MICLLLVSILWAPSFGIINRYLAGLDPVFVAFARLLIAFAIFAPFIRIKGLKPLLALWLMFIGAVQFGVMYVTYIYSYQFLEGHQVALYTIFTPLYVTLFNDLLDRRLRWKMLACAVLATVGAFIVLQGNLHDFDLRKGFLIVQISNLCFACGQVLYKRIMSRHSEIKDRHIFGILYLGAVLVAGAASSLFVDWTSLTLNRNEIITLVYLGILASGICFFLWNFGAKKTDAGTLAVFNNLKVPLAVACALALFGEKGDVPPLLLGGGIIVAALLLNEYAVRRDSRKSSV